MQRQPPSFDVVVIDEDQGLMPRLFECVAAQSARPGRRILVRRKGAAPDPLISRYGWETIECAGGRAAMANAGIRASAAEAVILLHPWTVLAGPETATELLAPLAADPAVAGVRAMFAGSREGNSWYRRRRATSADGGGEDTVLTSPNMGCCAVRRSVCLKVPFPEDIEGGSEDKVWAARALAAGHALADSPAFFLNEFQPPFIDQLRISYRQIATYYRATGELIQHNPTSFSKLCYMVFISAPRTGFRLALAEIVRFAAYTLIPVFHRRDAVNNNNNEKSRKEVLRHG